MSIKTVALAGATGNIGLPLLTSLLDAEFQVTALTRNASTIKLPSHPNVKALSVDYNDHDGLVTALEGIDAVISAIGFSGYAAGATPQTNLIHAAAEAGVKRFLPSEFGAEYDDFASDPSALEKAFAGDKLETRRLLKELSEKYPDFSYTFISTVRIFDNGEVVLQATTLETIGTAVAAVLLNPEKSKNTSIYVKDADVTQNLLLRLLKKVAPEKEWKVTYVTSEELETINAPELKKEKPDVSKIALTAVSQAMFSGKGSLPAEVDNKLLGLHESWSEEKLEEFMKNMFGSKE